MRQPGKVIWQSVLAIEFELWPSMISPVKKKNAKIKAHAAQEAQKAA